jgi:hypothetical protein
MSTLDYQVKPLVRCPNTDSGDGVFVRATTTIGGRDVVEEFFALGLYHMSAGFHFGEVSDGENAVSKVMVPLPEFPVTRIGGVERLSISDEGGVGRGASRWELRLKGT